jgi:hypothetical protein
MTEDMMVGICSTYRTEKDDNCPYIATRKCGSNRPFGRPRPRQWFTLK